MRQVRVKTTCDVPRITHDSSIFFSFPFPPRLKRTSDGGTVPGSGQCHTLFSHDEVMLNVLRCHLTYYGQAVTNAEAWFNIALRPRKPEGSLGRTAQDGHLDSHTVPELCLSAALLLHLRTSIKLTFRQSWCCFYCFP